MKNIIARISKHFTNLRNRIRMAICLRRAAAIIRKTKRAYPGCDGVMAMAWPTTGATGNGNAATGQYQASGTATTILWGTHNWSSITGWLTVTKVSQKTIVAFEDQLPNGDGLTAGLVLGIDGQEWNIDVRDDVNQVTADLQVGKAIVVRDGGGLVPGGTRGQTYSGIITGNGWDTAPKTPAGRTLTVKKFMLI